MEAFALAAGIIQVSDFGLKTLVLCRKLYKDGRVRPELTESCSSLSTAGQRLTTSLRSTNDAQRLSAQDQAVFDLAATCCQTANALQNELNRLRIFDGHHRVSQSIKLALKALWKSSHIEELEQRLRSHREAIHTVLLVSLRENQQRFHQVQTEISYKVDDILQAQPGASEVAFNDAQLGDRQRALDDNTRQRILSTLFFADITSRFEEMSPAHKRTFEWIFDENEPNDTRQRSNFLEWLKTGDGIFWIGGKLGSGKSTLMRFLYEHPRRRSALNYWANGLPCITAVFSLWNPGSSLQKTLAGVLRSLLYQTLKQDDRLDVSTAWLSTLDAHNIPAWTVERLKDLLWAVVDSNRAYFRFCFFIDGLDELDGDAQEIVDLVKDLADPTWSIKLCVASRPWNEFQHAFFNEGKLMLQMLTRNDIARHVIERLQTAVRRYASAFFIPIQHLTPLMLSIIEEAEGIFLWAKVIVSYCEHGIAEGASLLDLQGYVKSMPREMSDTYDRILKALVQRSPYPDLVQSARYFRLLSAGNGSDFSVAGEPDRPTTGRVDVLTLLTMSFTRYDDEQQATRPADLADVIRQCQRTISHVRARSVGLLEIGNPIFDRVPAENNARDFESFTMAPASRLRLTHRSVLDFFREGRSPLDLNIARTGHWHPDLAIARALWQQTRLLTHHHIFFYQHHDVVAFQDIQRYADIATAMRYVRQAELNTGKNFNKLGQDIIAEKCTLLILNAAFGRSERQISGEYHIWNQVVGAVSQSPQESLAYWLIPSSLTSRLRFDATEMLLCVVEGMSAHTKSSLSGFHGVQVSGTGDLHWVNLIEKCLIQGADVNHQDSRLVAFAPRLTPPTVWSALLLCLLRTADFEERTTESRLKPIRLLEQAHLCWARIFRLCLQSGADPNCPVHIDCLEERNFALPGQLMIVGEHPLAHLISLWTTMTPTTMLKVFFEASSVKELLQTLFDSGAAKYCVVNGVRSRSLEFFNEVELKQTQGRSGAFKLNKRISENCLLEFYRDVGDERHVSDTSSISDISMDEADGHVHSDQDCAIDDEVIPDLDTLLEVLQQAEVDRMIKHSVHATNRTFELAERSVGSTGPFSPPPISSGKQKRTRRSDEDSCSDSPYTPSKRRRQDKDSESDDLPEVGMRSFRESVRSRVPSPFN